MLKQQNSILINHAVNKGLNPAALMKDSGIEWIGHIPAHWEVKKLKYVAKTIKTGRTPPSNLPIDVYSDGIIDWFTPGDFKETGFLENAEKRVTEYPLKKGFIDLYPKNSVYLIGIGGTLGKVGLSFKAASCNQQLNVISFQNEDNAEFCMWFYFTNRKTIFSLTSYTTMPILNQFGTKKLPILCPPQSEIREINIKAREISKSFDDAQEVASKEIEKLQEFKQTLIAHAVTGKIKV